ncbi:MAG: thioredoxin family protein [Pseudomonadales bacterium]
MYFGPLIAALLMAIASGCDKAPQQAVSAPAEPSTESALQIQWFNGNAEQAFAAAREQQKPLFLYWGAEWCPPCHELKATVFQEPDFIRTSRQFITVYLDGDTQGAQQQAEKYNVMGYPTLVVFSSEGKEITRIPNGLDLASYTLVLAAVVNKLQPVGELLAKAEDQQTLSTAECQTLALHSWAQDVNKRSAGELVAGLQAAEQQCPADAISDRAALFLRRLIQTQGNELAMSPEQLSAAKQTLLAYFKEPKQLQSSFYLLLDAGEPLVDLFSEKETSNSEVLAGFDALYYSMATDSDRSLFDRIQSSRALFGLRERFAETEELKGPILSLSAQAQRMDRADPRFHATINAAGNLLREASLLKEARQLLTVESEKSKYAYYFMSELAHIEQLLGNKEEALSKLQQAFQQSRGPSTRFQWGVNYLKGLLEFDADNLSLIDRQFNAVFAELGQSEALYQRSRVRLVSLSEALETWSHENSNRLALSKTLVGLTTRYEVTPANE